MSIFVQNYIKEALDEEFKNATSNIEQVLEAASHKVTAIRPPITHHENYPD